jgi:hypothetical protein
MKRIAAALPAVAIVAAVALSSGQPATGQSDRAEVQSTVLISRARGGGAPNGPSTNAVISNDRRWARVIAYQSDASNMVAGDTNGVTDVFWVRRAGRFGNLGTVWLRGATRIASRPRGGRPANGPSWSPAVDGALYEAPSCVAYLSAASNLVRGDTNGRPDAFVTRLRTRQVWRVSLPRGRQARAATTQVAVSGDCSRVAFVTGGVVYVRVHGRTRRVGRGADPSFSTGLRNDLVYGGARGAYLSRGGTARSRLVAAGGRDPAFNDVKRQVVAYEKRAGGHWQVMFRDLGRPEQVASTRGGSLGNGDSRDPVIGNSGYYISFETDAGNLGVNALGRRGDYNSRADAYLYTNVRDLTLVQSVARKAVPLWGGGRHPSMSFYANYILFDSPSPLGSRNGPSQVWMRYLGGI